MNHGTMAGKFRQIAFLGNHLPRQCGIATFTTDLSGAIAAESPNADCLVVAMNDGGQKLCVSAKSPIRYPTGRYRIVSRHSLGATKGITPSQTSMRANAASKSSPTEDYLPLLGFFRYLKKSELGSSSMTSPLLLKLWRYASMLR